ncbi:Complexin [Paragonimus heterotremus]|uniref:Complexin n=1 Tax=Paragonimus heterotremus TaxID=100268 RepID=A0A8J4X376_9TREM|nr:Complexin [Paragonimus heterotremus]
MANYIAKTLVSKPLDAVKNATKDVSTRPIVDEDLEAQMLAAEEKRRERFESMEGERENMRQTIREKYGIKKREFLEVSDAETTRRPSTPRHSEVGLGASKRPVEEGQFTVNLPPTLRDVASKVAQVPQRLISGANENCEIM